MTDDSKWKVLIVDDDKSIHDVTKLVLQDFEYLKKKLQFIDAYNTQEAKAKLNEHPDIAIVLLDVVMEKDDSGLQLVHYIRDDLYNKLVRIILRTGQPGSAPENQVILDYDINDYKEKTDLTSNKLNTLMIASLRSYNELLESKNEQELIRTNAQKILLQKDEYIKLMADSLPVLISFIDGEEKIRFYNKIHELWFQKSSNELNALHTKDLFGDSSYNIFKKNWVRALEGHTINFDMQLEHSQLGKRSTNVTLVPYHSGEGVAGCFSLISDITERKQIEDNLLFLAKHDVLTGLYNRTYLDLYVDHAIQIAKDKNEMLAVLFLDVDEFKKINDTLGHEIGDLLLLSISEKLKKCLKSTDTITRFGGDEFVLLIENVKNKEYISEIAHRIVKMLSEPFVINKQVINVTVSLGISLYPHDGDSKDVLLKKADLAMYSIKYTGKNAFNYFNSDLLDIAFNKFNVENDLRKSLVENDFRMYYQPIFDLKTRKMVSVEALIRWQHPTRGLILPGEFISIAEETGLIIPLGEWILFTVCREIKKLLDETNSNIKVSINISTSQFMRINFVESIMKVIKTTQIPATSLQLELTESILIANFDTSLSHIEQLKKLGIEIMLDDFGSGFSSLSYLSRLPITGIKIDQSFSRFVTTDLRSAAIISSITQLMHKLGLQAIVEAIENKDQLYFVESCDCDMVQGNLMGKPMPLADLKVLLEKNKSASLETKW